MLQIDTTNIGTSKTFLNLQRTESSIVEHMELSIYKTTCDNRTLKKTILIFTGYEYKVCYYDLETNCRKTITGLVEELNSQYITMKTLNTSNSSTDEDADISVTRGLPSCGCILNKPDESKYNIVTIVNIPISNITDAAYVQGGTNPVPKKPKKGVKVVLLGISAEIVRAVVINLKMINDDCECGEAVRDVNLKSGNIYTIAYFSSKDKALYEFDGKLVAIHETTTPPSTDSVVRQTEQCGLNNSIYNTKCVCDPSNSVVDDYLEAEGLENDIMLTFDISSDFSGEFQSIMLSWIRECKLIKENPDDPSGPDDPDCDNCRIDMVTGKTPVSIYPATQKIIYTHEGLEGEMSFQELLDFYFCGE